MTGRHAPSVPDRIGRPQRSGAASAVSLRRVEALASHQLGLEKPDQTLQATALVHEAYLRLLEPAEVERPWNG